MELLERAANAIEPRGRMRMRRWCVENVFTYEGKPFDDNAFPHLGAPGGPMDAFDIPHVLNIWLQWASRLGKSFFGQCAFEKTADMNPCPMMFASSDQKLAVEVTQRTHSMLDYCERLAAQKLKRQRQDLISLRDCRIYVAWARSVSTLADKAVRVGHANEIDKWEHTSTSNEADPLKLFSDRFKEFPSHKKIFESTPAQKQSSRIERGRLASTNCTYWVPCPHCRRYQSLRMDGLKWQKNEAGKSDKDIARRTAHYECLHCQAAIRDEHRGPMMRAGVWAPEGCMVKDEAAFDAAARWPHESKPWGGWSLSNWIEGTPLRDGRDAGFQLSSLYALALSWGDIAAEWVDSQRNPQNLRNFVNQWLAETWSHAKNESTWEQLGKRLISGDFKRFEVPCWASLVTIGADAQEDGNRIPFVVTAWGPERRCAPIAYGELESVAALRADLLSRTYNYADGNGSLRPLVTLVDSGHRPTGYYEFCRECQSTGLQVYPCKGSSTALEADYVVSTLGPNTAMPGMRLVRVDTIRTQAWIERAIHSLEPDAGGAQLHAGTLAEHQDFLEQIRNDVAVLDEDSSNNEREKWERENAHIPNDFRDAWRYSFVAMLIATRGAPIGPRRMESTPKRSVVVSSGASRPDGRPW